MGLNTFNAVLPSPRDVSLPVDGGCALSSEGIST
ncbi:hypothetical protein AMEJIAPC_01062 [Caulobacter sp. NIBR1757]|nr:hypothetical protein AMEJIAPC_01062 [Caulobacter sp. NIBR1757]